jgi:hypothetical protein
LRSSRDAPATGADAETGYQSSCDRFEGALHESGRPDKEFNMAETNTDFDPFRATDPPVLVHDASPHDFERAWRGVEERAAADKPQCPICHEGTPAERGVVRFSCGDMITPEHTAG